MEILLELLFGLLQLIAEFVLQLVIEALWNLGLHGIRNFFRRPQSIHPWLAAIGYVIFGATAGGISLWIFPFQFIHGSGLRIANLALTPIAAGAAMALLGTWRRRRGEELILLDRFFYGFLFALAMAVVRFAFTQ